MEGKGQFPAQTKPLSTMVPGQQGKVVRISGEGPLRSRLAAMGLTPGTEIAVKGVAPLGDPVEVLVKGYRLTLRKTEAAGVQVEVT